MIKGEAVRSRVIDKCRPNTAAIIPEISPNSMRFDHDAENRADMDAGRMRNANIVNTPAILTASIITTLKEK